MITLNSTPGHYIRIVLADDYFVFREGFKALIKKEKHIKLVGEASNGKELIEVVSKQLPDVVFTDIQMPVMNGLEATRILSEKHPHVGVIALSMFNDDDLLVGMLEAGAKGYLLKDIERDELIQAIYKVYQKEFYYCTSCSNKLIRLMERNHFNPFKPAKKSIFNGRE